jgi:hypothetical protein
MRRILLLLALTAGALVLTAGSALASPDRGTRILATPLSFAVDPLQEELSIDAMSTSTSAGTQHVGPVSSSSPDSGTCGNDWALDTFDRFFTIRQTGPGTYTVYEQFKNGSFVTTSGPSPGACDTSDGYGPGVVSADLVGTMHGYEIIDVTCLTATPCESPTASCDGGACDTTAGFLAEFFPTATSNVATYFFHYAGYDGTNSGLVVQEWKNASCDRGGNHGDIATTTTPGVYIATCP